MTKISIIIPCYNAEKYIDRCIQSVANQTIGIECLQIICVDDASTDNSVYKLMEWEKRYPDNLCLIRLDENRRQGYARNLALDYAEGEYIFLVDADDWIEPDALETMYNIADSGHMDVVACRVKRDPEDELVFFSDTMTGAEDRDIFVESNDDRKGLILQHLGMGAYEKFIRRDFLIENNILYPEGYCYEDMY